MEYKKSWLRSTLYWGKIGVIGIVLGFGLQFASAWTNPTLPAPGGNVAGPVNLSAFAQYKTGAIGFGGLVKGFLGFDANGQRITSVATPVDGTDAVNKDYVTAAQGGGGKVIARMRVDLTKNVIKDSFNATLMERNGIPPSPALEEKPLGTTCLPNRPGVNPIGQCTGIYRFIFDNPQPNSNYYVVMTSSSHVVGMPIENASLSEHVYSQGTVNQSTLSLVDPAGFVFATDTMGPSDLMILVFAF